MITEQDYIDVKDLGHVTDALNCLLQVIVSVKNPIREVEYKEVRRILAIWQKELHKKIERKMHPNEPDL